MFYYLYQITNNLNGKIYVGVHKTKDLDDGYMGSGKIIKRAIEKHGVENFTKEILEHFESKEEMYAREKEVVTEEFLLREDVYNLRRGGFGGFEYINKNHKNGSIQGRRLGGKMCVLLHGSPLNTPENLGKGAKISKDKGVGSFYNDKLRKLAAIKANSIDANLKRVETLRKIGHQRGEKNSQFGSIWITNGTENRKISNLDPIPDNWRRGRSIKLNCGERSPKGEWVREENQ